MQAGIIHLDVYSAGMGKLQPTVCL